MSDRDREKRRQKKLQKERLKRKGKSRPGRDLRPAPQGGDPRRGLDWPVGPCWVSEGWEERGADVAVVFTRASAEGEAIAATFRAGLEISGFTESKLEGGFLAEQLAAAAARCSESTGLTMVEVVPAQAAAVLEAASFLGGDPASLALAESIVGDVDPAEAPLEVWTGAPNDGPPPKPEGLFSRLLGRILR